MVGKACVNIDDVFDFCPKKEFPLSKDNQGYQGYAVELSKKAKWMNYNNLLLPKCMRCTCLFEILNYLLIKLLCHSRGLFADSEIWYSDDMDNYLGDVDTIPTHRVFFRSTQHHFATFASLF